MAETNGATKPTKRSLPPPPGSWSPAHRLVQKARGPVDRFLAVEAASGIVLVVAAAIALVWANSPWNETYAAIWHTPFGVTLGPVSFERDLHFWINDGLMTIFFFVVGLEIRREIYRGELSELRRAALPLAAAMGGMAAPALIFVVAELRPGILPWVGRAHGDRHRLRRRRAGTSR